MVAGLLDGRNRQNGSQSLVAEKSGLIPPPREVELPLSDLRALPLVRVSGILSKSFARMTVWA